MAKLTRVRTRKRKNDTVLLHDGWQATRTKAGWLVIPPDGDDMLSTPIRGPLSERQVTSILYCVRNALRRGEERVRQPIRVALGLDP